MTTRERARPLPPEERRAALLAAARAVVLEHGRDTTTRLVAEAAGVAEGTLFRIFATKQDLLDAVLDAELDFTPFLEALGRLDRSLPLEERLVAGTRLLQERFAGIFALMTALGHQGPPKARPEDPEDRRRLLAEGMASLLDGDEHRLRVPPVEVVRMLRLLTFSGTHPHLSENHRVSAEEVVSLVLHGVLVRPGEDGARC